MEKKPVRILWNVFGTLVALVFPTMSNVLYYMFSFSWLSGRFFVLLDLALLILLIVFPLRAMRKNLHFPLVPLYTSVVGFLISAPMTPIMLPLFTENSRYGRGFGGEPLQTALLEMFFAIPFALAALLAAFLLTKRYRKKKQAGLPVLGPREYDFSVDQ